MAKKKKVEEKEIIVDETIIKTTPEIKEIEIVEVPEVTGAVALTDLQKLGNIVSSAKHLIEEIDGVNLGGPGQRAFDALKVTLGQI